jgi:hypothetical protein
MATPLPFNLPKGGILSAANDNIPTTNALKRRIEDEMQRRYANRTTISQYTPKAGDQEKFNKQKSKSLEESQQPLNRAASSKYAANAMENIIKPGLEAGLFMEGAGLVGKGVNALGKKLAEKQALKRAAMGGADESAVAGYTMKDGKQTLYNINGDELGTIDQSSQIPTDPRLRGKIMPINQYKPPITGEGAPYLTDDEKLGINDNNWEEIVKKYDPGSLLRTNKIKEADQVLLDFRNRISTPEGEKRMKSLLGDRYKEVKNNINELKLKADPETRAYYTSSMGGPYIGLHPELPTELVKPIVRHEIEHAVQKGATTEVDDILSNLELKKTPKDVNWDERKLSQKDKKINPQNLKYELKDKQNATDYFHSGSSGKEKGAFLGELQQYMVDNKLISHPYAVDEITPEKIKEVFIDNYFSKKEDEYPLRIFDIMKNTDNNYKVIADGLNKMLIGGGTVVGAKNILGQKNMK